jgi:hypothetical protein
MARTGVLLGIVIAALLVAACDDILDSEKGSGNVTTETREVSGFTEIVVLGSGEVTVDVTGSESLTIEAEDNIIPLLSTEVEGGRLELGAKSSISPTEPIRYTITSADLEGVTISGSGDIRASGIDSGTFAVEINGSGSVTPTGTTSTLSVEISGSGEYAGTDLTATTGEVQISGSGDAVMNVTDELDIRISGSGNVAYLGDPDVSQSISGSGDVTQR